MQQDAGSDPVIGIEVPQADGVPFREVLMTLAEAQGRLDKRRPFAPSTGMWPGGYTAGMESITSLIADMAEVTQNPYRILGAVIETTLSARGLGYDMPPWLADAAEGGQP